MIRIIIKAFRYKTKKEAAASAEGTPAQRVTKDVILKMEPYYMARPGGAPGNGRRMVKMQFGSGRWYHLPARDLIPVLEDLEFDVRDVRVSG